jgi:hypothetical protein
MGFLDGVKNFWSWISSFPDIDNLYEADGLKDATEKRRDYREGEQAKQLKVKTGQADDNVRSNLVGKIVDQSVYLLLSNGVEFDLPGDEETPEEVWLNACWSANHKESLLYKAAVNAADAGTGYIKIVPDGIEGKLGDKLDYVFPRLIGLNPQHLHMDTNPEDHEQVIRYTIEYTTEGPDGKPRKRREITEYIGPGYDENGSVVSQGDYWEISNWKKDYYDTQWSLMGEPVRWDYSFPPIIHWQNLPAPNSVYGLPDVLNDVLELQDRRNFTASNINKIIRYHAHPRTYTIGLSEPKKTSWGSDQLVQFSADAAGKGEIDNLEMQSDLASSIEYYDLLGKQMLDATNTVDISNLKDKLGQLTNFSVRVLFQDALWKLDTKREIWGQMLRDLNHRLLVIGGQRNVDPGEVVWPSSVLPVNEQEIIDAQKQELEMGLVSKQTLSQERGRDYEQEQERIDEEKSSETNIGEILATNFFRGQ